MKTITIIGGGASGLVASIAASSPQNKIIVLEKNNIFGKKILITGNGKCNYFNEDFTINHYNSTNLDLLSSIVTEDNKQKILNFWSSLGIIPKIKNNYYYPSSNLAVTIQNSLLLEAKNRNVDLRSNSEVLSITYNNNKYYITTTNETIISDILILATGSKAAPNTGSTGFGYDIASSLNHTVIPPLPALTALHGTTSYSSYFKDWNGIRTDVTVSLYQNNCLKKTVSGEIQLTDYGVSGICIFQLSGLVSKGLSQNNQEHLTIDFLPWLKVKNREELIKYLDNRNDLLPNRTITELLEGMLNYKLINIILKQNKISNTKHWPNLTSKEKYSLCVSLKTFNFPITSTNSYNKSQVCTGGIPLSEINISNFSSLKHPNLYIIGELLDVDGECGGYNLAFAWLSGLLSGQYLKGDNNA